MAHAERETAEGRTSAAYNCAGRETIEGLLAHKRGRP